MYPGKTPNKKYKLREAIEKGLQMRQQEQAPALDTSIIFNLPPEQFSLWKDLLYQHPHDEALRKKYALQQVTLTDLIGDYGVVLATNIFRRSGYAVHLQGIEFRYPQAAMLLRQLPEQEAYQEILSSKSSELKSLKTIPAIEKARSMPDLYVFWNSPHPEEKHARCIEVKTRKRSRMIHMEIGCLQRCMQHWDSTALLLGVFEFPKNKQYRVASKEELLLYGTMDFKRASWVYPLLQLGHDFRQNCPFFPRGVSSQEIQHHQEVMLESFLGYLIQREQEKHEGF